MSGSRKFRQFEHLPVELISRIVDNVHTRGCLVSEVDDFGVLPVIKNKDLHSLSTTSPLLRDLVQAKFFKTVTITARGFGSRATNDVNVRKYSFKRIAIRNNHRIGKHVKNVELVGDSDDHSWMFDDAMVDLLTTLCKNGNLRGFSVSSRGHRQINGIKLSQILFPVLPANLTTLSMDNVVLLCANPFDRFQALHDLTWRGVFFAGDAVYDSDDSQSDDSAIVDDDDALTVYTSTSEDESGCSEDETSCSGKMSGCSQYKSQCPQDVKDGSDLDIDEEKRDGSDVGSVVGGGSESGLEGEGSDAGREEGEVGEANEGDEPDLASEGNLSDHEVDEGNHGGGGGQELSIERVVLRKFTYSRVSPAIGDYIGPDGDSVMDYIDLSRISDAHISLNFRDDFDTLSSVLEASSQSLCDLSLDVGILSASNSGIHWLKTARARVSEALEDMDLRSLSLYVDSEKGHGRHKNDMNPALVGMVAALELFQNTSLASVHFTFAFGDRRGFKSLVLEGDWSIFDAALVSLAESCRTLSVGFKFEGDPFNERWVSGPILAFGDWHLELMLPLTFACKHIDLDPLSFVALT